MFEGAQILIEVPFQYSQRDQLLQFMEAKFPGAEILLIHAEVNEPQISETFVEHDSTAHRAHAEPAVQGQDATAVMEETKDVLLEFTKLGAPSP
jgi:hypothetical protein